jgi:adenosylcobinamide kinase/adenosylcobinamide-phosphate guanylyltransferase
LAEFTLAPPGPGRGSGGTIGTMLVLGGARSGKSAYAERIVLESAAAALYIATGAPGDAEMAERIRRHRAGRGDAWTTLEEPVDLCGALTRSARADRPILVDCLTLWLSNLMQVGADIATETGRLTELLPRLGSPVVLVANEVGLGIVPDNALARAFRDHAGRLNQAVAAAVDAVVFIAAGLPLRLKPR